MKRTRTILLSLRILCGVLLAALLLAGCAFPGAPGNSGRVPSTQSGTETSEPGLPETEKEEPVIRFSPFGEKVTYASIREGPSGTVLIVLENIDEDGSESDGSYVISSSRSLVIYDPYWGKCIRKIKLPYSADLSGHLYDDGTFLIAYTGETGSTYTFYDVTGREKNSVYIDDAAFCFITSDKRSAYFAARDLMRKDLVTGEVERVPLPGGMQVNGIRDMLPDSDRLVLSLPSEPFGTDACTALYDPESGDFVLLQKDYLSWDGYTGQSVLSCADPMGGTAFLFWDGTQCRKLTDPPHALYGEASIDGGYCLFHMEGQDDLLYSPEDNSYNRFPESGKLASGLFFLDDYDAFFCVERDDSGKLVPTLIRRGFLSFTEQSVPLAESADPLVDQTILFEYEKENEGTVLSGDLAACRARADELERKYGIRILLSDECALLSQNAGFRVHPSSEWSKDAEIESIQGSLDVMDSLFSTYPEDCFLHFHKGPDNGLLFMLTGAIESTYNVIAYERLEYTSRCYEIVFDMSYLYDLKCTLIHEMWHAVEDSTRDQFPYDEWNAIAPPGFAYQEAYENAAPIDGWTLYQSDPEDTYFVDEYSKTYAKEDRARIIEYFFGREELRSDLMASPHLVAKYRILVEHLRRAMGTDSWPERTAWEILP